MTPEYAKSYWKRPDVIERKRLRRLLDRDQEIARSRGWRESNPEKALSYEGLRYSRDKEKIAKRVQEWRKLNPGAKIKENAMRRARRNGSPGAGLSRGVFDALLQAQLGRCNACLGELVTVHLDHIEPLCRGGSNSDDNAQLLCAPCNLKKGSKILTRVSL